MPTKSTKQAKNREILKNKIKGKNSGVNNSNSLASQSYLIQGMHCASCAILIEKEIGKIGDFETIDVSRRENKLSLMLKDKTRKLPTTEELNNAINPFGYKILSNKDRKDKNKRGRGRREAKSVALVSFKSGSLLINRDKLSSVVFVSLGLTAVFLLYKLFEHFGIVSAINVNENSTLSIFFLFGIVAGLSSCFALVGSIVLSMSKGWHETYKNEESTLHKMYPHLLFNVGRLISFFILGGLLGLLGDVISVSEELVAVVSIIIALVIILTGFELIGLKLLPDIKLTALKNFSLNINENRLHINDKTIAKKRLIQHLSPFITGFLTFFIPCGFTLTVQAIAILSSDFWRGAFIMFAFALGTMPILLLVGFSTTKFYSNNNLAKNFIKLVAVLVIIFGLFTINLQLVRLGLPSFNDVKTRLFPPTNTIAISTTNENLPPIVNGKQIVKSKAAAYSYSPETIYVRKGIPVQWEIEDIGTSGCSNAIIAKDFFDGRIELTPGNTSLKEFTPQKVGTFRYSCWMGMIWGTIIVVE